MTGPQYDEQRTVADLMEFVQKDPRHTVYEIRRLRTENARLIDDRRKLIKALRVILKGEFGSGSAGKIAAGTYWASAESLLRELGES